MIWLEKHISEIEELLRQATPESLTYAALRSRMALELVCYHRLRTAHDYISADDIRRWQPRDVVNKLIQEVDPNVAATFTMSIGREPMEGTGKEATREDFEKVEFVELGRQVGFDSKKLGRIWNGLGNFLHVRVPRDSKADLMTFGKVEDVQSKVVEALTMLKELQRGTLVAIGSGPAVNFECGCGSINKRSATLLKDGQAVSCINPECPERWTVRKEGDDLTFERRTMTVRCKCGHANQLPEQVLLRLERDYRLEFRCVTCNAKNIVAWKLKYVSEKRSAAHQDARTDPA